MCFSAFGVPLATRGVCRSVLQCVAVCCSGLQAVAVSRQTGGVPIAMRGMCCSVLQSVGKQKGGIPLAMRDPQGTHGSFYLVCAASPLFFTLLIDFLSRC